MFLHSNLSYKEKLYNSLHMRFKSSTAMHGVMFDVILKSTKHWATDFFSSVGLGSLLTNVKRGEAKTNKIYERKNCLKLQAYHPNSVCVFRLLAG